MRAEPKRWHIDLPGTRVDEFPWRIHAQEFGSGGPATAIVAGMIGDSLPMRREGELASI